MGASAAFVAQSADAPRIVTLSLGSDPYSSVCNAPRGPGTGPPAGSGRLPARTPWRWPGGAASGTPPAADTSKSYGGWTSTSCWRIVRAVMSSSVTGILATVSPASRGKCMIQAERFVRRTRHQGRGPAARAHLQLDDEGMGRALPLVEQLRTSKSVTALTHTMRA